MSRFEQLYAENVNKSTKLPVKPSTELIPDEYIVPFNGTEAIHIFVADQDLVQNCKTFFSDLHIEISDDNVHCMESYLDVQQTVQRVQVVKFFEYFGDHYLFDIEKIHICKSLTKTRGSPLTEYDIQVQEISAQVTSENKHDKLYVASSQNETSLLMLLFWGYSNNDGMFTLEDDTIIPFYKIWSEILRFNGTHLRDIPKVILLNVIQSVKTYERDGVRDIPPASPYEVPNEADLLIIYKHNENKKESTVFMEELSDTIQKYGETEDLSSMVTIINTFHFTRPVIISTMLKKLYMRPYHISQFRGHYLNFHINHEETLAEMLRMDNILEDLKKEKLQRSPSLMRKMRNKISSSFRSRSSQSKEIDKEDRKSEKGDTKMKPKQQETHQLGTSSAPGPSSSSRTRTVSTSVFTDHSSRPSIDPIVPRTSAEKNPRRSSVSKGQGRKLSTGERKHWIP